MSITFNGVPASVTYTLPTGSEAGSPISLFTGATISQTMDSLTVAIVSGFESGDALGCTVTAGSITQAYNDTTGVLTFTGPDLVSNFQAMFDHIQFNTTSQSATNRVLSWAAMDGTYTANGQMTIDVPAPPPATEELFPSTSTPTNVDEPDTNAVTLGVKFTASESGAIDGVEFYKGVKNTGTHIAAAWDANGNLLAQAPFTNETASGWQTVMFTTPVSVTAGSTYTVGYFDPNGEYADDQNAFASPVTDAAGHLTVPVDGGVYAYGSVLTFPTQEWNASNYWVGPIFQPSLAVQDPPPPPTSGVLSLGVFSPWNPSLNPPGDDFNMWGGFIGRPGTSLMNMGMGIQTNGDWAAYTGSASAVVQAWATINGGQPLPDGQNEVNMGPFPNGVGATLTIAGAPSSVPIGQGPYDQYWLDIVNSFNGTWSKVRFRLCWEFEGGWYPWGFQSGSQNQQTYAADYIATYRRMVAVIRSRMPEATFVFCAADGNTMNGGAPYPTWEECYPGDDVVDWVGTDVYCANGRDLTLTDPVALWNQEAAPGISRAQALALAHKKGWGIFETAVGSGAVPDNPLWIENLAGACETAMQQGLNAYIGYWNQVYSGATTGLGGLPNSFAQYEKVFPQGFHA